MLYGTIGVRLNFENLGGSGLELPYNSFSLLFQGVFLALLLFHVSEQKSILWSRPLALFSGSMAVLILFSLINSYSLQATYLSTLGLSLGLFTVLLLSQIPKNNSFWRYSGYILISSCTLEAIWIIIQQLFPYFAQLFGYNPSYARPFGSFQQPNLAASFLVTGLAVLFLFLFQSSTSTKIKKTLLLSLYLISLATVLLFSRSGFISFTLVTLLSLPSYIQLVKKKDTRKYLTFGVPISVISGIITASLLIALNATLPRNVEQLSSYTNRLEMYRQSISMIAEKPLQGWQQGNFEAAFRKYHAERYASGNTKHIFGGDVGHPHNELLKLGVENGLLSLIIILSFIFYFLWKTLSLATSLKVKLGFLSVLIPLSLHANTEFPFHQSITHWFLLVFLVSYIIVTINQQQLIKFDNTSLKPLILALIIPTFAIVSLNFQASWYISRYLQSNYKNGSLLHNVITPVGIEEKYYSELMAYNLKQGVKNKDTQALLAYLEWFKEIDPNHDRADIHINAIQIMNVLGLKQQAKLQTERSVNLFPHSTKLKNLEASLNGKH